MFGYRPTHQSIEQLSNQSIGKMGGMYHLLIGNYLSEDAQDVPSLMSRFKGGDE